MHTDISLLYTRNWATPGGPTSDVVNPATEEVIATLPHSSVTDIQRMLVDAENGFRLWRDLTAYERYRIMRAGANNIRANVEHIAHVLTLEQGKTIAESRTEVLAAADCLDWCAEEGRRLYGRIVAGRFKNIRHHVVKEPVGVVAAFAPWNFPALTPMRKIAGALAAGCSIIIKPAEEAPGTAIELAKCLFDAGLPDHVLSLLFGDPDMISKMLLAAPVVRKISFTGSTPVGKHLLRIAADGVKRATMELGGHAPVLIFEDAEVEMAARLTAASKFRNSGQVCISPTRFFVHEAVHKTFLTAFTNFARDLKVGPGLDPSTQMGPLANRRRLDAMANIVSDAVSKGATVTTGGRRLGNKGYFYAPTVLDGVPDNALIMSQEPFGPIAPIVPFRSFDEVIARANELPFGLAAYAFTSSDTTAERVSQELSVGMVGVNNLGVSYPELPFGGVKESGYGSEGGVEGLEAYLNIKLVSRA